ncbi:MAG: trimeric intracellular cation channel family protein, partial [Opitutaceae bacterium]
LTPGASCDLPRRGRCTLICTLVLKGNFQLPLVFDIGATAAFALTGAFAGARRGYDMVGVFFLAAATALGGGLIRDGIFLHRGVPVAVENPLYLLTVVVACTAGLLLASRMRRFEHWIMFGDALGLGTYAVVGAQMTLQAGLGITAALLIGVLNATGGGLLRDVLAREEPFVFKPGEFYALVAFMGAACFILLAAVLQVDATASALAAIALTFGLRILTVRYKWRTHPVTLTLPPDV